MKYLQLNSEGRVEGVIVQEGLEEFDYDACVALEDTAVYPESLMEAPLDWLFINGVFVHDPQEQEVYIPTQEDINNVNLNYLEETDWYVIRSFEKGIAIPQEILPKRQEAREAIVQG